MHSGITDPINLGSDELVTIGGLVDVIEQQMRTHRAQETTSRFAVAH
ncbi:hypothetical protein GGP97_002736 [Salinibacter ruber]|nr:hypothetical protein [Salinibacter ruber]MCS4174799.1 hypothetical protein [Salinibacter ruber]